MLPRLRSRPGVPPGILGVLIAAGSIAQFYAEHEHPIADTIEALIVLGFSLAVFYAAYRLETADISFSRALDVTSLALGMGCLGLLIVGFTTVTYMMETPRIEETIDIVYLLFLGLSGGLAIGYPMGYYFIQLRDEYDQTRRLNKRLKVTQRALRHNLRNELTILLGAIENVLEATEDESLRTQLELVRDGQRRIKRLSEKAGVLEDIWEVDTEATRDLARIVRKSVETYQRHHPAVDFEVTAPETAPVCAHPYLDEAISEAIENAIQHNEPDELRVSLTIDRPASGTYRLRVADDGVGIPPVEVEALQQPEETSLEHASGLGVWIIYSVVTATGELSVETNEPTGSVVEMRFPAAGEADRRDR